MCIDLAVSEMRNHEVGADIAQVDVRSVKAVVRRRQIQTMVTDGTMAHHQRINAQIEGSLLVGVF